MATKLVLATVLLGLIYAYTERSPASDGNIFPDELTVMLAWLASALLLSAVVLVWQMLFVVPYKLWFQEKSRADEAETAAVPKSEVARIVADCTTGGEIDIPRLRSEIDRITDPDREYYEAWDELQAKEQSERQYREEIIRQQAIVRAKAEMMTQRLHSRNHSMLTNDQHLAAMWDSEQRGETYDEMHERTLRKPDAT